MAYADLIDDEGIDQQFIIQVKPRRKVTGFTLFSGSVYSLSFDYGPVTSVQQNGIDLALGGSSALSAGQWYYDEDTQTLYVRTTTSANPSGFFVTANYLISAATIDLHFFRDPLDGSSKQVYYDGWVAKSPSLKRSVSESIFGFMPILSGAVTLINAEHFFERHVYDSSFNKSEIKIFHLLRETIKDEFIVANTKLVYQGVCQNVSYDVEKIEIKTFDGVDKLNVGYRNPVADSFYDTGFFPNLNPAFSGKPIRYVYGKVDGFIPVNIDFVQDEPLDTDNRIWVAIGEQTNLANITKTVGGGVHTTTRTFVTGGTVGLNVGDSIWLDRAAGTDEYVFVTAVGASSVDHVAIASPMTNGDTLKRSFVGSVTIVQEEKTYKPMFGRDYQTSAALAAGTSGFTFTDAFETTLAMNVLSSADLVFCRVYGRTNNLTLGGPTFGSNDSNTGNIAKPAQVLLDLLKTVLGFSESALNIASFTQFLTDRPETLSFSIPSQSTDSMPTIKTLIAELFQTSLFSFYLDDDQKWKVKALAPIVSTVKTIADDEISRNSFSAEFDYADVTSDIAVEYAFREVSSTRPGQGSQVFTAIYTSDTALYLHQISTQKTFSSKLLLAADALVLAERLSYIFGDRRGIINFRTKNRFFNTDMQESLEISREKLPGFTYVEDTFQARNVSVIQTEKSLKAVVLTADDQKGIQDNSGNW